MDPLTPKSEMKRRGKEKRKNRNKNKRRSKDSEKSMKLRRRKMKSSMNSGLSPTGKLNLMQMMDWMIGMKMTKKM